MFLRGTTRKKDGKEHCYWSIVENKRLSDGRVLQRHVLYLGEINSSQELGWRKSIEVFEEGAERPRTLALFPEDRCEALATDAVVVRLRLGELRLCRPRQWGACWLALRLWQELRLDGFWAGRLEPSRKGTRWDQVLFVLVAYRLIAPGSEWRLHREWFERSALADLLGAVVTPEGLPLAYEVLAGNTADNTTLRAFLARIEGQYGKARRVWVMDRGVPTEGVLEEMRQGAPPVQYLVGTPKGRLSQLQKHLLTRPWQEARPGVEVKLLPQEGELYVYAQSRDRVAKERAMRQRKLKRLWARLKQLSAMTLTRDHEWRATT